jgi:hypothetical protein
MFLLQFSIREYLPLRNFPTGFIKEVIIYSYNALVLWKIH